MMLEVLNGPLMGLSGDSGFERAEIATLARFCVFLA